MKVLHVGPNSVHVLNFIHALNKRSSVASFLITDAEISDSEIVAVVENLHTLNPVKILNKVKRIKKTVDQIKPDVIHIHQVNRMGFWIARLAKRLGIPIIITAWGSDVLLMPKQNKLYKFLVQSTLSKAQIITADAQLMIDEMEKLVPNKKYVWLQYGIDPIEGKQKERIVYSNRLHKPLYRIDRIVDLFAEFHQSNPEWRMKIAASGTETAALKDKVNALKLSEVVSFVGWLSHEENRLNYESAAIYISIPESDGTSVSLLEAMSAGCIPVVSDLPSNREWIKDGENGIVWNGKENPLEQALTLNREKLMEANEQLIQQNATRVSSVKRFVELYSEICKFKA
jgi:glycosyltransferase involved in cell wall biosynthesis